MNGIFDFMNATPQSFKKPEKRKSPMILKCPAPKVSRNSTDSRFDSNYHTVKKHRLSQNTVFPSESELIKLPKFSDTNVTQIVDNRPDDEAPKMVNGYKKHYECKVTEVYQIAFQVGDSDRIYVPNVLEPQDVNYHYQSNLKVTEDTINQIWNSMTPMILNDEYQQEYLALKNEGMAKLEDYLSTNLSTLIFKSRLVEKQSMLEHHNLIVTLRQKMFTLIKKVFSKINFSPNFDPISMDLDRVIDHLIIVQSCCLTNDDKTYHRLIQSIPDRQALDPIVVLCKDLSAYFRELQIKSLKLIKLLLPNLCLPEDFHEFNDLNGLITRICSVN